VTTALVVAAVFGAAGAVSARAMRHWTARPDVAARFARGHGPFSDGLPGVHRRYQRLSFAVLCRGPSGRGASRRRKETPWQS
jgi:hypothetical protein